FFCFSSRRRHTRFSRDWSSDVCSSDLEAQRAVLARAVAQEAPVLLLDEPTASLDLGHAVEVLEVVEDLRRDGGLTVVTAIHDLTLAARFCDRLVLVSGGEVVAEGPIGSVLTET